MPGIAVLGIVEPGIVDPGRNDRVAVGKGKPLGKCWLAWQSQSRQCGTMSVPASWVGGDFPLAASFADQEFGISPDEELAISVGCINRK